MSKWSRRKVLKGMFQGAIVSVGLPLLDCMLDDNGQALASGAPLPTRFGTWFWPCGVNAARFFPDKVGTDFDFKPELAALLPFKESIAVFSGFNAHLDGRPNLVHWSGIMSVLSGTAPHTGGDGVGASDAATIDNLVADYFSSRNPTRFKSLEVSCTGQPRVSYSMRPGNTMNPTEVDPVQLYNRLFGPEFRDPNASEFKPDPAVMLQTSVLSSVAESRKDLLKEVGAADRERLDAYFTSVRDLEQQLSLMLKKPEPIESCTVPELPAQFEPGATWDDAVKTHDILTDLLVMALACNQTRVFHLALSTAVSNLRQRGNAVALHEWTHLEAVDTTLGYQPESTFFLERMMGLFAGMLAKMEAIKEGDRTLLDNSLILATSESNFAKLHTLESMPMVVAGTGGGRWKAGRHVAGGGDTVARVGLTIQQALGMPVGSWGTGANATSQPISEVLA